MALIELRLKPVFPQDFFSFEDPSLIPDHYDEWPTTPSILGQWALFGWTSGGRTMDFALDVISSEQAELLAEAKKQYFEETIDVFGYSMDVYILNPDGNHRRYYKGRDV